MIDAGNTSGTASAEILEAIPSWKDRGLEVIYAPMLGDNRLEMLALLLDGESRDSPVEIRGTLAPEDLAETEESAASFHMLLPLPPDAA